MDATYLFSVIHLEFSPAGSTRRELEEMLMDNFQDFVMVLDEGTVSRYDCPVAWNYNDNHLDDNLEADTEESVEKFDTVELTSAGIQAKNTGS